MADGDDLAEAPAGDKRSASAIRDRGVIVVRRSPWRAAITEAGRYYLERSRSPEKARKQTVAQVEPPANRSSAENIEVRPPQTTNASLGGRDGSACHHTPPLKSRLGAEPPQWSYLELQFGNIYAYNQQSYPSCGLEIQEWTVNSDQQPLCTSCGGR